MYLFELRAKSGFLEKLQNRNHVVNQYFVQKKLINTGIGKSSWKFLSNLWLVSLLG